MGLMDKFKNLFTEEIEEDEEFEEPKKVVKVEKSQVEIASPMPPKVEKRVEKHIEKHNDFVEQPQREETIEKIKEPEEYKFPFFDDNDFETIEVKKEKKEKKKSSYRKEMYNPPREEKKVFKPSPIISPVYGILDKNYQKEDIMPKIAGKGSGDGDDMIDVFRNKAYGTLEDDIDTTLFGKNRVLFDEEDITIEEIDEFENDHVLLEDEGPRHSKVDELLREKKETKKPKPISDEELFSMIDSMYEKGDK